MANYTSLLLRACRYNDSIAVESYIKAGADVNAEDESKETPLKLTIERNNIDSVRLLINAGANVNYIDIYDRHLLFYACRININIEIIQLFINAGANVNAHTITRYSILHFASFNGFSDIVELLINEGADVNAQTIDNNDTPLSRACAMNKKNTIELLILHGANTNHPDLIDNPLLNNIIQDINIRLKHKFIRI
jgi:ankyrin repeat protein